MVIKQLKLLLLIFDKHPPKSSSFTLLPLLPAGTVWLLRILWAPIIRVQKLHSQDNSHTMSQQDAVALEVTGSEDAHQRIAAMSSCRLVCQRHGPAGGSAFWCAAHTSLLTVSRDSGALTFTSWETQTEQQQPKLYILSSSEYELIVIFYTTSKSWIVATSFNVLLFFISQKQSIVHAVKSVSL